MIRNDFCLIVKDTPFVALLMRIPTIANYLDSPYNTRGNEYPDLSNEIIFFKSAENVFRAKKIIEPNGDISFVGNKEHYTIWNQESLYFDLND